MTRVAGPDLTFWYEIVNVKNFNKVMAKFQEVSVKQLTYGHDILNKNIDEILTQIKTHKILICLF